MNDAAYDAIVVGAGIGGLSAAITLAAAGQRVLVLEAHEAAGGKAGVCQLEGIEVDTGPSVLTLPEVFEQLIESAGLEPQRELVLRRASPSFRYLYADGVSLSLHHELADTLKSVNDVLGPDAAVEFDRFMRYAAGIWEAAKPAFVFGPAPSIPGILAQGLSGLRAMASIDPLRSMQGAIAARVRSPHLRMLLARYATYNGSDVRSVPATLNCIAHVELALGGFGVTGGIAALVRALVRAARKLGVTFGFRMPVERLCLRRSRVVGVEARGAFVAAPVVVMNADVAHLVRDLLEPGAAHGISLSNSPSMSGYTAIYRARRRPRAPHTVLFPHDYDAEFSDIFDRQRPPREPTVYVCSQEACHGRAGWADDEPLFIMANAPAEPVRGASSDAVWTELSQAVHTRLTGAGILDADSRLLWQRTPIDLAQRFPRSRGSIYGASSNGLTAAFQRPGNVVSRVAGLFLASGSAHPGGGLPLAAQSGRTAARAALDFSTGLAS
jgi:1-hydroxycarotenoid 3,4-desaturase